MPELRTAQLSDIFSAFHITAPFTLTNHILCGTVKVSNSLEYPRLCNGVWRMPHVVCGGNTHADFAKAQVRGGASMNGSGTSGNTHDRCHKSIEVRGGA